MVLADITKRIQTVNNQQTAFPEKIYEGRQTEDNQKMMYPGTIYGRKSYDGRPIQYNQQRTFPKDLRKENQECSKDDP